MLPEDDKLAVDEAERVQNRTLNHEFIMNHKDTKTLRHYGRLSV